MRVSSAHGHTYVRTYVYVCGTELEGAAEWEGVVALGTVRWAGRGTHRGAGGHGGRYGHAHASLRQAPCTVQ